MSYLRARLPPRIGIDIGGTFTDFVFELGDERHTYKCLSTPHAPEQAVIAGIAHLLQLTDTPASALGAVLHGTTLATNAVIERRGARTALVTTAGFRDVIETGCEARADHYDLRVKKPEPLVPRDLRLTVVERMGAKGQVLLPLDEVSVDRVADALAAQEVRSVAIAFMHSYANADHEKRTAERLMRRLPDLSFSLSSDVSPELREFERFSTTCVNAYVLPLMASYLQRLSEALKSMGIDVPLLMMTSDGGLCDVETARRYPVRLLESGPAGGALLASHVSRTLGLDRVLSLDIGGTTAKLCFIDDGSPQMSRALEVARLYRFKPGSGIPLRIPVVELCEIGAGGGSIAGIDRLGRVKVGPTSAGSQPGPACYGLGGAHATLTDTHLVAGRLDPEYFAAGSLALDTDAALDALDRTIASPLGVGRDTAAYAVAEVADEAMAGAAREHAIELGKTLAGRTLIAFGGSAPLHAARLAEKLGIDRVVVPVAAGVGSAYGFLVAPVSFEAARSLYQALSELDALQVNALLQELRNEAASVIDHASPAKAAEEATQAFAYMRYRGQGHEIQVPIRELTIDPTSVVVLRADFEHQYQQRFGRLIPHADVEILSWSVRVSHTPPIPTNATNEAHSLTAPDARMLAATAPLPVDVRSVLDQSSQTRVDAAFHRRHTLLDGAVILGPAVIVDDETTIVVPPEFTARCVPSGHLVLERQRSSTEFQVSQEAYQ